ncbi:DUF4921 family protein [Gleimia hominis]|uniref:DUF4921 family protein n=1 Tax=Gleimia hominis TaxID=595468 RepID=UPI000C80FAFA|nr:DUF4921 family protein [Gleimia hominis]WIK64444.1 DUF4921 family protein [Gleimia hominis]
MARERTKMHSIDRLADGTVKQKNLLTGTEVWTVPGRDHRPLAPLDPSIEPIDQAQAGRYCAFCEDRYIETPPEKARVIRDAAGSWQTLTELSASELNQTVAEFRRIPNLFEIVSYNYWHLNHGHVPSETEHRRMADYLAHPQGYDHVMRVVKARLKASGMSEEDYASLDDAQLLAHANGFFSGGHDLIVARRHYTDDAKTNVELASSGTLTEDEHYQYMQFTAQTMEDLYGLDPAVRYVACFQNWLKPAGASFDHLHKQLVAIDAHSVQTAAELRRIRKDPQIYEQILSVGVTGDLILAQNEHAIAMAGWGHRYPTIAIWPLGPARNPWEVSPETMRGVSDIVHAAHAATGSQVPCNEEWYHRPPDINTPMRWRMLLKWRISTLAGFEGGTRIYLNTIDPWGVRDRVLPQLHQLRDEGKISSDIALGSECHVSADLLS